MVITGRMTELNMPKKIFPIVFIVIALLAHYSYADPAILSVMSQWNSGGGAPAAFCDTPGVFCFDGTTDGQISWDTTPGTEDCDGYDANLDWCDYDTTIPSGTGYADIHSIGIRGTNTALLIKALSSSQTEFYIDMWQRFTDVTTVTSLRMYQTGDSTSNLSVYLSSGSVMRLYYNGGAGNIESTSTFSVDTWYHLGAYYKQETGSNDGILRLWMNTDGTTFDAGDLEASTTSADTGETASVDIAFTGPSDGNTAFSSLVRVTSGACPWSYE